MDSVSSRTPEGRPTPCPICGNEVQIDPLLPPGDATCPICGSILWFDTTSFTESPSPRDIAKRIRETANDLQELAASQIPESSFWNCFVPRVQISLAALGSVVWKKGGRNPEAVHQYGWVGDAKSLLSLAKEAFSTDKASMTLWSPPKIGGVVIGEWLVLHQPLRSHSATSHVLQIIQRPDQHEITRRGYLRFLGQMAEIGESYLNSSHAD
jgi:hypothetical protein